MVIDRTEAGQAAVNLFRRAALPVPLNPVLITSGHEITLDTGTWHVPKELASTLQVLFQYRRLRVAKLPERQMLVKELLAFRVKVTAATSETIESCRERDHDDLVLAVAMAAWIGECLGLGPLEFAMSPSTPLGSNAARWGHFGLGRH